MDDNRTFPDGTLEYHPRLRELREALSPDPASTILRTWWFQPAGEKIALFVREWTANSSRQPKGVIVVFHGMGGDGEFFVLLADHVVKHGYNVIAFDYAGHGLSGGKRGDMKDVLAHARHGSELLKLVASTHVGVPLFVLGESMGGAVSIDMLATTPDGELPRIAGVILLAPAVKIKKAAITPRDVISLIGNAILYPFKPSRAGFSRGSSPEKIEKKKQIMNPVHLQYDLENPRHQEKFSLRYMAQLMRGIDIAFKQGPGRVKQPVLLFYGTNDDGIDEDGILSFFDRLHVEDKELHVLEGAPHSMVTHATFQPCWEVILAWLGKHCQEVH